MSSKKGVYIATLIGLMLGITLDYLIHHQHISAFSYSVIILFALLYAFAYNDAHNLRLIVSSLVMALFLSIPIFPITLNKPPEDAIHLLNFLLAFPFFIYIGHSFHYAYHQDNTWKVSYSSLFAAVWNTIPLIFLAFVFSSLANLLIMLGAFVFKTVGNTFLWSLYFENSHFRLISNVTLFFIGLGVGQQNIKIIYSLRVLLLKMMQYLFPLLAFISSLYFILYLTHSVSAGPDFIEPLVVLMPLCILGIIFFNAYYQDGDTESEFPNWLQVFLKIYRVILYILVLMMTYRFFQKLPVETNVLIYLLSGIFFSATYAFTVLCTAKKEQKWIHAGNIGTAAFFMIALFLTNLPYLPISFNLGQDTVMGVPVHTLLGQSSLP